MSKDPHIYSIKTQNIPRNEIYLSSEFKNIYKLIYSGNFPKAQIQVDQIRTENSITNRDGIELTLIEIKILTELKNFEKAFKLITEVFNLTNSEGNKLQEIDTNISLALVHLAQNSIDESLEICNKSYGLLHNLFTKENEAYMLRKASILFIEGNVYRRKGKLDKAIESLQQSIFIFQNLGLNYEIACSLNLLGIALGQKGEFDPAHHNLNRSLEIFVTYKNKKQILGVLNNIGMVLWQKGEPRKALDYYKRGQRIADELDNKLVSAGLLLNMGLIHRDMGNYSFSLDHYQKSLVLYEELKIKREIASCLNNIGCILMMKGDLDRSYGYFEQSLTIKKEVGDKVGIAFCYNNIGFISEMKGDIVNANEEYRKGLELFEQVGNNLNISLSLGNLVRVSILDESFLSYEHYLEQLKRLHDTDMNKQINQRYRFSKALVLKMSERVAKKGEAQQILEQLAQEPINLDLGIRVLLNLCELLLEELRITGNEEVVGEVKTHLEKVHEIAEEQNFYPWLVQVYWLQSRLAMLELNVEKVQNLLDLAQDLAKSKGLTQFVTLISQERSSLMDQLSKWQRFIDQKPPLKDVAVFTQFEDLLERVIQNKLYNKEEEVLDYAANAKQLVDYLDKEGIQ